jgi:hypothetical protein
MWRPTEIQELRDAGGMSTHLIALADSLMLHSESVLPQVLALSAFGGELGPELGVRLLRLKVLPVLVVDLPFEPRKIFFGGLLALSGGIGFVCSSVDQADATNRGHTFQELGVVPHPLSLELLEFCLLAAALNGPWMVQDNKRVTQCLQSYKHITTSTAPIQACDGTLDI